MAKNSARKLLTFREGTDRMVDRALAVLGLEEGTARDQGARIGPPDPFPGPSQ